MPILAHLDLDAFFAAVEELEDPSLRSQPLVVGGNPQGRGVVATANYVAREFGIRSAMSSAEALRRCPDVVFVRPRHALYKQYSRAVWDTIREVVPRVEQVGIDEGYLDLGTVVPAVPRREGGRRGSADIGARRDLALVLARRLDVEGRLQGRLRPTQAGRDHRRAAGEGGTLPRPVPRARASRGRAEGRAAARGRRREDRRRPRRISGTESYGSSCPARSGRCCAIARSGVDPRDLDEETERISISTEETFERDISDRALLYAEIRLMAASVADALVQRRLSARTVTTKLRYSDFSIRSRSTTLAAPIDEADRIAELACSLLDRGLRDRPGALRLVGVGVSGLSEFRQLTFDP